MEFVPQAGMPWREQLKAWLAMPLVQRSLIALILVNAVLLGLETGATALAGWTPWLIAADTAILAVFVVEIALRLVASADQELAQLRLEFAALRNDLRTVRAPLSGARRRG